MIDNAIPGTTREAAYDGIEAALGARLTYAIVDTPVGNVVQAATNVGIVETAPTFYAVNFVVPSVDVGDYAIVWYVDGVAVAREQLRVTALESVTIPPTISLDLTYAQISDFRNYPPGDVTSTDDEIVRWILAAERDIDGAVGHYTIEEGQTLKFAPMSKLATTERDTLVRATCAQAYYRKTMGPDFFVRAQYATSKGPEFETTGTLPEVGPGAWRELEGSGLLRLTTTWHGRGDDPPWRDFAYG
jgi:hypothetical protein